MTRQFFQRRDTSQLGFGEVVRIPNEEEVDYELKSIKDRPPTPVVRL